MFFSYKGGLLFEGGNTVFNSHVLQMLHPYLTQRKSTFGHIILRLAVLLFNYIAFFFDDAFSSNMVRSLHKVVYLDSPWEAGAMSKSMAERATS
jgi:hypothetical protein